MAAGLTWIVSLLCVAGASPVLRSTLVVPAGHNVSLTCNLTSGAITWFLLRSDQLQALLTVRPDKLGGDTVNFGAADSSRVRAAGRQESGHVGLEILEVGETDAGLYFCSGLCTGAVCVGRGVRLSVGGPDEDSGRRPCWSPGIWVLLAVVALCVVAIIVGLCLCSGKSAVCCCSGNMSVKVTEEESLHYSILKLADKPRPFDRGATGLVENGVVYSTVMSRKNPNGSHDYR